MIQKLIEFFAFTDPNVKYVVFGSLLLGASSAIVGCFAFLRKRALVGDAVAHAVLPGVALAFLVFQTKDPLVLLIGAFLTGWMSLYAIDWISNHSKIKPDAAIGLVLSVFFGIGIVLLTYIQKSGNASQSGLDEFLFGSAASMIGGDLITFAVLSLLIIATVVLFFRPFSLIAFDPQHAKVLGLNVPLYEFLLASLTVLTIALGIQAVGVVLMAALLITPAAAARFWTHYLTYMVVLAAVFGALSALLGAFVSYSASGMPTGPWIVMIVSIIAFASLLFAPKSGLLPRFVRQRKNKRKRIKENILKALYQLGEENGTTAQPGSEEVIKQYRSFRKNELRKGLKRLQKENLVKKTSDGWQLKEKGWAEGQRITRLHRLWELYLTEYMNIAPDHVHHDAEGIEHVITPEMETKLKAMMDYPEKDPHQSEIPYEGGQPK